MSIFSIFPLSVIHCQGIPFTINFKKEVYQGGTQNWGICQDEDGIIYIANNNGLLEFDGRSWRINPVSNQTIIRSVVNGKDSKIWVGAQSEFGYFEPNANGILNYHSLRYLTTQNPLADIWKIAIAEDQTTFLQTTKMIYSIKDKTLKQYRTNSTYLFFGKVNNRLFAQDLNKGLLEWKNDSFEVSKASLPSEFDIISSVLPWSKDTILITTQYGKIWSLNGNSITPWKTEVSEFLRENRIYAATILADGKLALGTTRAGIVILDRQGKPWAFLNKKNGLQNNSILTLFTDRQGNLWAGTENGIDYIQVNSPYSFLLPDGDLEGAAYYANLDGPWAYFGTNNGLYTTLMPSNKSLANSNFSLVENTKGQVWTTSRISDDLFAGLHEGPFQLSTPLRAKPIGTFAGAWSFIPIEGHEDLMLVGAYHGLHLFKRLNGIWQHVKMYPEFTQESCRIVVMEGSHILWVSHPYRGVYRAELSPDFMNLKLKLFNSKNGLPSDNLNRVYKIGSEILFSSEVGILKYDGLKDKFEPYQLLNSFFPNSRIKYLQEGKKGEIWFVADNQVGYLEVVSNQAEKQYRKRTLSYLEGKLLGGFEFILPYGIENVLFGTDRGYILYDRRLINKLPEKVLLREVAISSPSDSLVFIQRGATSGVTEFRNHIHFSRHENNLRFGYSLLWYGNYEKIEYSYKLDGYDTNWSDWSNKTVKEYPKLKPGSYTFNVKARYADVSETTTTSFSFEVIPPWYRSNLAFSLYALSALALLVYLVIAPKKKFEREKEVLTSEYQRMKEDHRRHNEEAKLELDKVKQEKLHAEIAYKNQELASATMHLLQKGEILHKIHDGIQHILRNCTEVETKKNLLALTRMLVQDAQLDTDWEQFTERFDQVHSEFIKRLRVEFPELTPKDQRLCAYLRMNLASKEIAPLLNISIRGVEISRYRLRKKLHLGKDVNLTDFLLKY
jgi:ligand-binding sensor domain-containing protein/DNA-binding CsgD family transcriptional regulator